LTPAVVAFVSERGGSRNIYYATTAQGDAGPVTQVTTALRSHLPAIQPDGQWINLPRTTLRATSTSPTDGTESTNLTNQLPGYGLLLAYSPTRQIVFSSERDGWTELYLMN